VDRVVAGIPEDILVGDSRHTVLEVPVGRDKVDLQIDSVGLVHCSVEVVGLVSVIRQVTVHKVAGAL
jgi:hypothetical protein